MQGLAVLIFPLIVMAFALAMEKVETRLTGRDTTEAEVTDLVDHATHAASSRPPGIDHRVDHHEQLRESA